MLTVCNSIYALVTYAEITHFQRYDLTLKWLLSSIAREVGVKRGSGRNQEIPGVIFGRGAPGAYFSVLVVFY